MLNDPSRFCEVLVENYEAVVLSDETTDSDDLRLGKTITTCIVESGTFTFTEFMRTLMMGDAFNFKSIVWDWQTDDENANLLYVITVYNT